MLLDLSKKFGIYLIAFGFLAITLFAFKRKLELWLIVPFLLSIPLVLLFVPRLTIPLFVASFFVGKYLYFVGYIFITLTEAMLPIVILGWASKYYISGFNVKDFKLNLPIFYALLMFFVFAFVSTSVNVYRNTYGYNVVSAVYLIKCLELVIVFVIFSDKSLSIDINKVIKVVLLFSLLQLPVSLFQYIHLAITMSDFNVARTLVRGTLSYHHSMLGTFMLFPIAFCIHLIWQAESFAQKRRYFILILIFVWVILLSGSRSALLGFAASSALFAIVRFKFSTKYIVAIMVASVILVILYFYSPLGRILSTTFSSYGTGRMDSSSMSRLLLWQGALSHFVSAGIVEKFLGVAMGCFPTVDYHFVIWDGSKTISGAHNNVIHVLIETGIIGVTTFITLFVLIIIKLFKMGKYDTLAKSYLYLTIGMLVTGITQETFWFQRAFGSMWLFYIFILSLILSRDKNKEELTNTKLKIS